MSHLHLSRHLAVAATTALAVGAAAVPAFAATRPQTKPTLKTETARAESTPLGAVIVHQDTLTRIDVPLDGAEIKTWSANETANERAEAAVRAVAPEPNSDQAEIKREWLKGERYFVTADRLFVKYLHAHPSGATPSPLKTTGLNDSTDGDDLNGWAFNALATPDNPGRPPRS